MSILFIILSLLLIYALAKLLLKQPLKTLLIGNLSVAILVGYLVAIICTFFHEGLPNDIGCFKSWANMLFSDGFSNFYTSDAFTDYPPGYMYVLYVIGAIRSFFSIPNDSYTYVFLLKTPAIIANIVTGIFIYKIAEKRTSERNSVLLALFYMLNPMVLFNASVWGQVDAIHTLTLVVAMYFVIEKKLLPSMLMFVVSVFIKPQAFMFSPIYMYAFFVFLKEKSDGLFLYLMSEKENGFSFRDCVKAGQDFFDRLKTLLTYCLMSAALAILMMLPFADLSRGGINFKPVINQYVNTLGSYNYGTVNAFNFYGLLGYNWKDASETTLLFLPLAVWGTLALVVIVIASLYFLNRSKTKSNVFFMCAFINFCTFMFSIKMHERYSFPILAFLLMAYVYRMDKRLLYLYIGTTAGILINCVDVFRSIIAGEAVGLTITIFSALMLAVFIYMIRLTVTVYKKESDDDDVSETGDIFAALKIAPIKPAPFQIEATEPVAKMVKKDYIAVLVLTAVYAVIAFLNLGNTTSPQTLWTMASGSEFVVDLGESPDVSRMQWLLGPNAAAKFSVSFSDDYDTWSEPLAVETKSVFCWSELKIDDSGRYVWITVDDGELMLMELAFRDENDVLIEDMVFEEKELPLFDEQSLVPDGETYMNSTYFDEIYHGRTAYELIHKMKVYEWTHPPLGKVIISAGISLFGMTPFGWRFSGTLFGVLMLPLIYVFAKRMFKNTFWSFFAAFIFAFDFMHYTQTRIATIDTYITFFVIAMYYFMYRYWKTSFYDTKLSKTLVPLFLSGLMMGLGIACKWPGVYAAAGLATLFFIVVARRYMEYRFIKISEMRVIHTDEDVAAVPEDAFDFEPIKKSGDILAKFKKNTIITMLWCVLFFVIMPAAIYFISYIPYYATGSLYPGRELIRFLNDSTFAQSLLPDNAFGNYIAAVIQNQFDMFKYHANLESTHSFSSPWYSWPVIGRPLYYYSQTFSETIKAGISAFGNPAVWWTGIIAFCYGAFKAVWTKSKTLVFLLIAFMAQLVFWMPVARTTYIYHYFPCIPFLVLLITYLFRDIANKYKEIRIPNPFIDQKAAEKRFSGFKIRPAMLYLGIVALFFIVYYPVLTGIPVYAPFVEAVLRLLPSWVLI